MMKLGDVTQMLNVWPIYLQNWVVSGVNVGKYTIHLASGQAKVFLEGCTFQPPRTLCIQAVWRRKLPHWSNYFFEPQFIQGATKIIHYPCQMAMGSKSLISQSIYDLQCMWSCMPSTLWIHCHPLAASLALKRLEAMPAWAQKVRSRCLGVVHPIPTGYCFIGILRFLRIQIYSNTEDSEAPY